uniref:Helicase n=1 Tax=viral metagenome TaxID=1070528 RepID=A0A6C0BLK9_9ZZZZ
MSNNTPEETTVSTFEDLGLKDQLLRGIYAYGWEKPSFIQQRGIPLILKHDDVILQAQSGLGKTGTFSIAMLQKISEAVPSIQGIIVLNTRELANQVYKVIQMLGDRMDLNFVKCVGGIRVNEQLDFPQRATILIGTPGKICSVLDHRMIPQKIGTRVLVVDEFDKTLEEDFIPTMKKIFAYTNENSQIILSSATINDAVLDLSRHFMREPTVISVKDEDLSLEGIKQYHVICDKEEWKFDTILDLYKSLVISQSIIFVNSKRHCDQLEDMFRDRDFAIRSLHGGMEQCERDQIMREFRLGKIRILLSTDLTARGIDVPSISLVINYDLPMDKSQYIHRVGRTGRYGKKGFAINLLSYREQSQLKAIEECYHITIPELPCDFKNIIN